MNRWHWAFSGVVMVSAFMMASVPKNTFTELDSKSVAFPEAYIPSGSVALENLAEGAVANMAAYANFKARYGPGWGIFISPNNGRPSYIGGQGIPMIPGTGNTLTAAQAFGDPGRKATVEEVDRLIRNFLADHFALFGLKDGDLSLVAESGFYGDRGYLCVMNYQISHAGVPIEGALFQARLNHGNLVDMGISGQYQAPTIQVEPKVPAQEALQALEKHIGGFSDSDRLLNPGSLKLVPIYLGDALAYGRRIGHVLVWEFEFEREATLGSWRGWVDALSGKLLRFYDATLYGTYKKIHAKVYADHIGEALTDKPLAFVKENTGGSFSSIAGLYPYSGPAATCDLNWTDRPPGLTYAFAWEMCENAPAYSTDTGDIDWGGTTEQDCSYVQGPTGMATEAALMGMYHVTTKKMAALSYLPANTWLDDPLQLWVNWPETCNAIGSPDYLKFFRSSEGCNNAALNAGVIVHELGHGLDARDGGLTLDYGTGEAYGDTMDMIYTRDSCHGTGFYNGTCDGYGNACLECTGSREEDCLKKENQLRSTAQNFICPNCSEAPDYADPCGREGHCTASGMTETMWDLATRELTSRSGMSQDTAWEYFSRLFYLSRPMSVWMYECTPAEHCWEWMTQGCGAYTWYRGFRAVDDDNGNLCDGTPNAEAIYWAFTYHNIGCQPPPECPNENTDSSTCPSLIAPELPPPTLSPYAIQLTWTPVAGALEYKIFRNELGADREFMIIATVAAGTTSYLDTQLSPDVSYFYSVQAVGENPSCTGIMSTVRSASVPGRPDCQVPSPPSGSVTCTGSQNQIQVSWTNDGTGDGYRAYRRKEGEYSWTAVSGYGGIPSFTDTNLLCGEDYQYRIVSAEADQGTCESQPGAVSGTCQASCCTPPGPPILNTIQQECGQLTLTWSPGTGSTAAYNIYRRKGGCGGYYHKIAMGVTGTSYTDSDFTESEDYAYVIRGACDAAGLYESGASNCLAERVVFPAAVPSNLAITPSCTTMELSWNASLNAEIYRIYRTTNPDCSTDRYLIGTTADLSYSDSGANGSTDYYYTVAAHNSVCGVSGLSDCVMKRLNAPPEDPQAPGFEDIDCNSLRVHWAAAFRATGYDVYRCEGGCGGTCALRATDRTTTYFDDSSLSMDTLYGYYIVAKNACGNSDSGTCAEVTTLGLPADPTSLTAAGTCDGVELLWTDIPNANKYEVYRTTAPGCGSGLQLLASTSLNEYDDTSAVRGTPYYYSIRAVNHCGVSAYSACVVGTRKDFSQAPLSLAASSYCGYVRLDWAGVSGVTGYAVYRTDNPDCITDSAQVGTVGPTQSWYEDATAVPGVAYWYRIGSCNACGCVNFSECAAGSRLAPPPDVASLTALGECNDVHLSWTASVGATSYKIHRTESADCVTGLTQIASAGTNVFDDVTAVAGTTYHYKVMATGNCGDAGFSPCASAARLDRPGAPAAPTYANVHCQNLTLLWSPPPGATHVDIYRVVGPCGTGSLLASNQTGTSYMDTFLASNTQYSYYLVAKNGCGSSDPGACSSVTTYDLPADPTNLVQIADCPTTVLQWNGAAGAEEYFVWRTLNPDCSNLGMWSTAETTFTDNTAGAGVTYYYKIQAHNECGTSAGYSNCIPAAKGTAPAPPVTITPTAQCTSINLAWPAVPGAVSYNIWRSPDSNCTTGLEQIGTSGTPSFSDSTAALGVRYYYRVQSVNLCGTSAVSGCSAGIERLTPPSPPDPPTFTAVTCDSITFTWNTVAGATGYDVYWRYNECGTGTLLISDLTVTSYTDTGLAPGAKYAYHVVAKNACGDSTPGACRTMVPGPPAPPAGLIVNGWCTEIALSWTEVAGAVSYEIWRTANANCIDDFALIGTAEGMPSYGDTTAVAGITYHYVVKAVNSCATSGGSACVSGALLAPPAKPTNFAATGVCSGVTLTWDDVPGADNYILYRLDPFGNPVESFPGVSSPYLDSTAVEGITYTYWVQAGNFCGASPMSDNSAHARLLSPIPTISGLSMNTCPDLTVILTTEAGQTDYQWYKSGLPIPGANASTYEATESDAYTVSYTASNGCMGISAPHGVIIYVCGPPVIVYQSYTDLLEVNGDGDTILEAGEQWQITVTVTNTGERQANSVLGSLAGMGAYTCTNPGGFGHVPVGGTGSCIFEFIPDTSSWYGTYGCGGMMQLDLVGKSSDGGAFAYADDTYFTALTVGGPGAPIWENASQVEATLDAQDGTDTSALDPAFTGPAGDAVSATVNWMLYDDPALDLTACVAIRLRAPDGSSELVLKAAGTMDPASADALAFYRAHGPGTYTLILEELAACGTGAAHIVAGQMSVQTDPGCSSGDAECGTAAPEVSDDAAHALRATRNGSNVDILFEDVSASRYQIYVSISPETLPFNNTSPDGRLECDLEGLGPALDGMLSLGNYDLQGDGDIPGSPAALYFLITADNGPGSEGILGRQTGGTERTAQAYCSR